MSQCENYKPLTPKLALDLAAPRTWVASVFPALFGNFYCWQQGMGLTWIRGIMLLAACILLQSAVNTFNDYFDFIKGTDSEGDHVEISDAVLIYGNINPKSALILGIVYMAAGGFGAYLLYGKRDDSGAYRHYRRCRHPSLFGRSGSGVLSSDR